MFIGGYPWLIYWIDRVEGTETRSILVHTEDGVRGVYPGMPGYRACLPWREGLFTRQRGVAPGVPGGRRVLHRVYPDSPRLASARLGSPRLPYTNYILVIWNSKGCETVSETRPRRGRGRVEDTPDLGPRTQSSVLGILDSDLGLRPRSSFQYTDLGPRTPSSVLVY